MAGLIVDAGALYEALTGTRPGAVVRERMREASYLAAPHVVDVEVLSVIRRYEQLGRLDPTSARHAVEDLAIWPAERYSHRPFLARVWELRENVRPWDGLYVVLAEALGATLLTTDARLAAASGPQCPIDVVGDAA
jgi:predicted nucleic acid-binding protein